jgi:hypothetical protein
MSDIDYLNSVAGGYRLSQVLYVFAELCVADLLAGGPHGPAELAACTAADEDALVRLLRVCAAIGLVESMPDGMFKLTARGALLRADVDGSLRPRALSCGDPWQWGPWGELLDVVRSGRPALGAQHTTSFDFFNQTPGAGDTFMARMTVESHRRGKAIAAAFDFGAALCVVDVGGGRGGVLGHILRRHDHLHGVLIDLPYAISTAPEVLVALGVADRCEVVAGDFRDAVPPGGDVYLLSAILHSWSDEDAVGLLSRCLEHNAQVLIVDEVIDMAEPSTALLLKDLQLMVFSKGRQRRLGELHAIVEQTGATVVAETPLGNGEMLLCVARHSS